MIWTPNPTAGSDEIIADHGFTIENLLTSLGVRLKISPF